MVVQSFACAPIETVASKATVKAASSFFTDLLLGVVRITPACGVAAARSCPARVTTGQGQGLRAKTACSAGKAYQVKKVPYSVKYRMASWDGFKRSQKDADT
jgi:hypothetical protein